MNISKINCTPISPKMVSFGNSDYEEQAKTAEIPADDFAPPAMTDEEKLDNYSDLYDKVTAKAPTNKLGKIAGNIAAIGLTAASFAVVGSKVLRKILPDVKVEKYADDFKKAITSESGAKRIEDIKGLFAKLTKRLEGKKAQKYATKLEDAVSASLDKLKELDPKKISAGFKTASKAAGGVAGGVAALTDKDKDGNSDLKEKVEGAMGIADKAGNAILALQN